MFPPNAHAIFATSPILAATDITHSPWLYLLGSGGGLALLGLIIKTVMDVLNGRAAGVETRNADMKTQRDTAWEERDEERRERILSDRRAAAEARNARRLWDWAAKLRRMLIALGVPEDKIPAEPVLEDPNTITKES